MKRVLVTGAGGFVGANLVRRLSADGHRVTAAVRPGADCWRLEAPSEGLDRLEVRPLDVADPGAVERLVGEARPEWAFHAAAHGAYSWQTNARRIFAINVLGTVHLVEACRAVGCEALVHAGSSSEYGPKDHAPAEDELLAPPSPYGVAKAAATLYCRQASQEGGMRISTLRLYSVYGPFEDPRRLFPRLVARALRGELPPLASPAIAHDFVAAQDAVEAFLVAAEKAPGGAIYNVGSGRQSTLREIVELVRRAFGVQARPAWGSAPERAHDTATWVADPGRIREDLGWRAEVALEDGLLRMAGWLGSDPSFAERYGLREADSLSEARR